jgi:hypothetical protein
MLKNRKQDSIPDIKPSRSACLAATELLNFRFLLTEEKLSFVIAVTNTRADLNVQIAKNHIVVDTMATLVGFAIITYRGGRNATNEGGGDVEKW